MENNCRGWNVDKRAVTAGHGLVDFGCVHLLTSLLQYAQVREQLKSGLSYPLDPERQTEAWWQMSLPTETPHLPSAVESSLAFLTH